MRRSLIAGLLCGAAGFGQPTLRIVSPAAGTVIEAAKPFTVVLEATPPAAFKTAAVGIFGDPFLRIADVPPYRLTVPLPPTVVGAQDLIASATFPQGGGADAEWVSVRIEHSEPPVRLWAEPARLDFFDEGNFETLHLFGSFPEADRVDLSSSTLTRYESSSSLARMLPEAVVTAIRPGTARITIHYRGRTVVVPVTVGARK